MSASVAPRPAATLVVVRDGPAGLEVLLLRRAEKGDHNSGAWVFPGGLLDACDRRCHDACSGLDDASASARLGTDAGGLDYYVAAIRECFEEAGILFALRDDGRVLTMEGDPGARLQAQRAPLHAGTCDFAQLCATEGLRLATERLHYVAHWVTPRGRSKRFDTRFFVAVMPEGQSSMHDALETVDQVWLRPSDALAPENSRRLMTPTRSMLELIGSFPDTHALLAWARSPREVAKVMPRLGRDRNGLRPVQRQDPAWAEIGRLDPHGEGTAWCEIHPGVAVRLSPRVLRVSAEGTPPSNSYLVGAEGGDWAVIDPGPADEGHLAALGGAAAGPIRWILLTETSGAPAAELLAARTGARIVDPQSARAEPIALAADTSIRVIRRQPAGSLAYLLVQEKTLFPGAGAGQEELRAGDVEWIAPGQGFLVAA